MSHCQTGASASTEFIPRSLGLVVSLVEIGKVLVKNSALTEHVFRWGRMPATQALMATCSHPQPAALCTGYSIY